MSAPRPASSLRLEPPASGFWELDPVHFPRPATRYWAETHPEPFKRGTAEFARGYGMLIDGIEMSYVQGFAYKTVRPAPESEIPERFARANRPLTALPARPSRRPSRRSTGCRRSERGTHS